MTVTAGCGNSHDVWLDDLAIKNYAEDISSPLVFKPGDNDMIPGGFSRGIGVRYTSVMSFETGGKARKFSAIAVPSKKMPDAAPVEFYVIGDRKILFESKTLRSGDPPRLIDVDLQGIRRVGLLVVKSGKAGQRAHCLLGRCQIRHGRRCQPSSRDREQQNVHPDTATASGTPDPLGTDLWGHPGKSLPVHDCRHREPAHDLQRRFSPRRLIAR